MGYGVAMTKTCSTHVTPEERATLSLGLTQGHLLRVIARVWATRPAPQAASYHTGPPAVSLCGAKLNLLNPRDCGNSSIPGCGSKYGRIWLKAARSNRLPGASDVRILTTCGKR